MLALRYLRARRREGFISVISLFSFLGILLGVATLIVVMAVLNGFRAELLDKILGFQGHASVYHADVSPIAELRGICKRASPRSRASPGPWHWSKARPWPRRCATIPARWCAAFPKPTSPSCRASTTSDLRTALKEPGVPDETPSFAGFDKSGGVAIGERMAWKHQLGLGSNLTIISPEGPDTVVGNAPRIRDYPVVAIFKVGMSDYDESVIYMPLAEAQDYFVIGRWRHARSR